MQAYLPDINSKYLMYTRKVLDKVETRKWSACLGAINSINALLPDEYQIIFSTIEYNEKIKHNVFSKCIKCESKIDFKSVKIMEVIAPILEGFLTGNSIQKIWSCPNCRHENKLSQTQVIQSRIQEPYYFKIVPNPPERKDGISDRRTYDREMERWVWACLAELEKQMSEFRKANWKPGDEGFDSMDVDTSIEEGKPLADN